MSAELNPCPWCGESPDANGENTYRLTDGLKYGAVQCCIVGPEVRTDYKDVAHWKDRAIEAWNERAVPAQGALTDALPEPWESRLPLCPSHEKLTQAMEGEIADWRVKGQVSDATDAARYRFLRDQMCFTTEPMQYPTMAWGGVPAPEHDPHRDWMGDRFAASVDRTVDAAIQAQAGDAQSGADHG